MNHILIMEDNREAFSDVLPPELSERNRTTIGAYDDDGAVCGAVSMTQGTDRMDLDWIFVMPQVRRRGIASGLVALLSDYAIQAEGRPLYCSFAADEDEGNGLYMFFVSDAMSALGFDVFYAYDRYIITPEALEKMSEKEKPAKPDKIWPFFDLPLYRQYAVLQKLSDRYEISDFTEWAESCEKRLCRILIREKKIDALILVLKRMDGDLELSYLYGKNPISTVSLIFDTAAAARKLYPEAGLVFDAVSPSADSMARKLFETCRSVPVYEAEQ